MTPNSSLLTVYLEHNPIQVSKDVGAEDSIPQRYLVICPFAFNKKIAPFSERPPIPEENQAYSAHLDSDRLHLMQMKRLEMIGGMEKLIVIQSLL